MKTRDYDGLPLIKVIGVGGGGSNAVSRIAAEKTAGVELVAVNTDAQALTHVDADVRIRIGDKLTKGLGVGGDPARGLRAAEESRDELKEAVRGAEMVFVTAGMGGGTGTGASPIVAEVARECGALTIGVVTRPFSFEGTRRMLRAEEGIAELREKVDTLIVIPNDRLLAICDPKVSFEDALRAADAARAAITSPLLDVSIQGARGVLFNVVGGKNLGLQEVHLAAQVIAEVVDPDAEIVFGAAIDPELGDEVKVTVIATGFEAPSRHEERRHAVVAGEIGAADEPARGPWAELPQVDTELPAFLRRGVTAR